MSGEELYSMWCDQAARVWPRPKGVLYGAMNEPPPAGKPLAWQFLPVHEARAWAALAHDVTVIKEDAETAEVTS